MKPVVRKQKLAAFTVTEALVALVIAGVGISGTISAYVISAKHADWVLCSHAAQNLAMQRLQQTQTAQWNTTMSPAVDELIPSNFPRIERPLEIPRTPHNGLTGVVSTKISDVSSNPPMRLVEVDCTWWFDGRGPFTNSVSAVRSPE